MRSSATLVNEKFKLTWQKERTTSFFFWRKLAPPFFSLVYEFCDLVTIWELFKTVSFNYFALFSFLLFPNACAALSSKNQLYCSDFFRKNQTQALTGKNDKTYFNNRGNLVRNLISWNFWVKLIWIHLYKYPSISPRSCIPGGGLQECIMSSHAIFARTWSSLVLVWDFVTNSSAGAQVSRCWQVD